MKKSERDRRREKVREALKRPWLAYTIATCSAVVLFILLSNFGALTKFLRSIYNLFSPIIIGLILAYILNPLVNVFERHVLKRMKKVKLKHTLSVLIALLLFLIAVGGLMVLLIPSV
ncbi:MAG: AI-2E family transporter, partial [Lachnospiraceae bacterium]|nr:AI-2E family transporter [Lachnospiraceae bacterium]